MEHVFDLDGFGKRLAVFLITIGPGLIFTGDDLFALEAKVKETTRAVMVGDPSIAREGQGLTHGAGHREDEAITGDEFLRRRLEESVTAPEQSIVGFSAGLAGLQPSSLGRAFEFAMRIEGMEPWRDRKLEVVAATLAERGDAATALSVYQMISNFRRGVGYAYLAQLAAERGDAEGAEQLIAMIDRDGGAAQSWEIERITAHLIAAHAVLGNLEEANALLDGLSDRSALTYAKARIEEAKAMRGEEYDLTIPDDDGAHYVPRPDRFAFVDAQRRLASRRLEDLREEDKDILPALKMYREAIGMARDTNIPMGPFLVSLAKEMKSKGLEGAWEQLMEPASLQIGALEPGDGSPDQVNVAGELVELYSGTEHAARANELLGKNRRHILEHVNAMEQPGALARVAKAWHSLGKSEKANAQFLEAAEIASAHQVPRVRALGGFSIAMAYYDAGRALDANVEALFESILSELPDETGVMKARVSSRRSLFDDGAESEKKP
ncbi:MAG: hypothetical protein AAGD22_06155 [Verrucomicrobiota bacterium]